MKKYEYDAIIEVLADDEEAAIAKLDELITVVVKGDLQIGVAIDSDHPRISEKDEE